MVNHLTQTALQSKSYVYQETIEHLIMTEFEFIQVGEIAINGLGSAAMNIVTVIFAYVIAAHFVGKSLSRSAAISISIVYSLWLLLPFGGVYGNVDLLAKNAIEFQSVFPDSYAVTPVGSIVYVMAIIPLFLGWIGSLFYMHRIIRKNIEDDSSNDS